MSSAALSWHLAAGERYYPTTVEWSALAALGTGPVLDVAALDAAAAPLLVAGDKYVSATRFDALNRPIQSVMPYAAAGGKPSVVQPAYNEAGLLETVDVWVRATAAPAALLNGATADQHAITNVGYNAHGKREVLDYGNGSHSEYQYDPLTWRVQTVTTTRPDPNPDARTVQALSYTYDPIGNVTRLRDDADLHDVVYFSNQRVDPTLDYTYDPTYRLVRATGREHLGQGGAGALLPSVQTSNDDSARMASAPGVRFINPGDGKAMGNYTETYSYDAVGNFLQMVHQVASGGWTRSYSYQETSQVTPGEINNRLSTTSLPGDAAAGPYSAAYTYDAHGSMTSMPHLPVMSWDEQDRLQSTTRQRKLGGMPETTFYTYDGSGSRARKRTYAATAADGITPVLRKERIYLGPLEIYREFEADGVTPKLERETLQVLLDHRRVALIETRTLGADPAPLQLVRYQYTNHLGSAVLELTDTAEVLSYEEYFPYGSTAYQATRNQTDLPKRYRYTGQERDEESDLDYHGARYCAPWIGRWTSTDPAGVADGTNVYLYVHCNPVAYSDPTGMWTWRTVAIVAAVVVVGAAVTIATAGLAGPAIAAGIGAAAGAVGASSAVATVATGIVVGAVAGAAGGAAGELTRQVASGEEISGRRIGQAALTGAAAGAVTGGLSSLATVRQAAGAVQAGRAATTSARVGQYARSVARGAAHGAAGDAAAEGTRQLVSGEHLDVRRIAWAGAQGAAIGGGLAAAAPVARAALARARGGESAAEGAASGGRARRADGTSGGTPGRTQGARTSINTPAARAARTQNAGPGFRTQRAAARGALRDANPRSIRANREFGGEIYRQSSTGRYHYTRPRRGTADGFAGPDPARVPAGGTLVGDYHTHGDYSRQPTPGGRIYRTSRAATDTLHSNEFSGTDIAGITADAAGQPGYRGYVGTPSGVFREFTPGPGGGTVRNIN